MQSKYLLISGLAMISLSNCKKPEACVQPSASVVKLGQEVTFTDCSENSEYYEYNFGDGNLSEEKAPTHAFESPGKFTVTVEVKNKKQKKENQATATVTVEDYTASDVVGNWTLYKTADFMDGYWFGGSTGGGATSPNQKYTFTSDSVSIYDNGNPPYMISKELWTKTDAGEIALGSSVYKVVKVYNNELYLKREDGFMGYTIYYFRR